MFVICSHKYIYIYRCNEYRLRNKVKDLLLLLVDLLLESAGIKDNASKVDLTEQW